MSAEHAVAVVGMACRYPQAPDTDRYWANLLAGAEGISHFPRADLVARGVDLARRPDFVPAKGVLAGAGTFDWSFFGYSRAEAAGIDPQQRVFLECASAAIDDAGIDPTRFPGWIGVYAGADVVPASPSGHVSELAAVIGREKDFLATRVAYKLGLRGPALTVQTACSTSLTATHLAVTALLGNECDAALAGGVTVTGTDDWGYLYDEGGILSADGHCRPFDERAGGTVPSEGVGVVVLKRLADALRDGDRIAAVVLGSAVNNDGADKMGYTAPSIAGQSEVIGYAQRVAGVDPADLDYVEAHGTATRLGDPVEVQALTDVFRTNTDATGWCLLGAVKSNLGHTGAAAGAAGLIKTALMLERRTIVPTLHFDRPNPLLDLESTPFRVATEAAPWPDRGTPLAAVSSFGVGGTNAHVIVGAAPDRARPVRPGPRIIPLAAASADALNRSRRELADRLPDHTLAEVARTLAGRRAHRHRHAVVAGDTDEAASLLRDTVPGNGSPRSLRRVAFLFPGQGALTDAAGAAAYRLLGGFRTYFDEIADTVGHHVDLSPVVVPAGDPDWFTDTVHQQLGLFALGYALGRQLRDWGVRPSAMFGNSVGEYTAATLAGVWAPDVAAGLVHARATAMLATEPGVMLSVGAGRDEVVRRLEPHGEISVAVAGPGRTVLSGTEAAMEKLLAGDDLRGLDVRTLGTRRAFHSPAMAPAAVALTATMTGTPSHVPRTPLVSNETGDWADPDAVGHPDYWAGQMLNSVLLTDGAATLLAEDHDTVIELGPGTSMIATLRRHPDWAAGTTAIPLLGSTGERDLLRAVGALWERGVDQALADLPPDAEAVRCSLPPHPFAATDPDTGAVSRPAATAPVVSRDPVRTVLEEVWRAALGVSTVADTDDFFALGGESLMAVNLLRLVRERTGRTVSVTEFSAQATFGALTRLVGHDTALPAGVVALRDGAGPPLFLAADAMDTALGYQALATLLDRPVLGLEPLRPATNVEHLAAQHVERVLAIQPDGPHTVGGWSFGAIVAHELAAQLERRGARVDLLVCLDGYVPATGRPVAFDPGYLAGSLRSLAGALFGTRFRLAPGLRGRFAGNIAAMLRHRPRPVTCPTVVFTTGATVSAARLSRSHPGGVTVHRADGDHWSMLADPHVRTLATRLREVLPVTVHRGETHDR